MKMDIIVKIGLVALICAMMAGSALAWTIQDDDVDLGSGTFELVPENNASASYDIAWKSDLGALHRGSLDNSFNYAVSDAWYPYYDSFYLLEINGTVDDYANSEAWFLYINDNLAPYGLGNNTIVDNDHVKFMYCPYNTTTWLPYEDLATDKVMLKIDIR